MEGIRRGRLLPYFAGIGGVLAGTAAYGVLSGTGIISAGATQVLSDHAMTVIPAIAGILSFFVARRHHGHQRIAWMLIGGWGLLSAAGNGAWSYYELVAHTNPFPSIADLGYLSANLMAVAGVMTFVVAASRASTFRIVLDSALIAGSVFIVSWTTILGPLYRASSGGFFSSAVGLAYPVIDVAFVSVVVLVVSRSTVAGRFILGIIGLGLIGWTIADTGFAWLTTLNSYTSGGPVDAGWIGGDALICLAALYALRRRGEFAEREATTARGWRVHLPYVVAGGALVAGVIGLFLRPGLDPVVMYALMIVLLLVVVRQFLVVLEQRTTTIDHMRSVDEMKNGILRAVSHELRTPLTFIKGAAQILSEDEDALTPDIRKNFLERLIANADRLESFLTGLLDLERLTRGVLEPARKRVEMRALVMRVVDAVYPSSHHLTVTGPEVWGNVDSAQVERIVENLFVNAVRHTPPGTQIVGTVEHTSDGVLITVSDDGPGVPEHLREKIFQPFAQGDASVESGSGTGVGLALVAKFAQLHGGYAWVEASESGGARFRVLLAEPDEIPSPEPDPLVIGSDVAETALAG